MSSGAGEPGPQGLGAAGIHRQVAAALAYTAWVRALGLKAEKPGWKTPPCKSRERAPGSS